MNKIYIYILLIFLSCKFYKDENSKDSLIISDSFVGTWIQNDVLFNREIKENPSVRHWGNLSDAYGEIKMIINIDSTYQSHFDNQVNNGKWKIEGSIFYMTPYNDDEKWLPFKYKLNKGELFIYNDPWLMALSRK